MLAIVAIMADARRGNRSIHSLTGQSVGVHNLSIDAQGQCIGCGTRQLKFCAFALDCIDCILIKHNLVPAIKAGTLAVIQAILLDNAEAIVFVEVVIFDVEAQQGKEAICVGAVIVLNHHRNRRILTVRPVPAGIAAFIVGPQLTMGLVCGIPFRIIQFCKPTGLEATGNIVNLFRGHKAVGIALPIQQQRLTVDVQLLAVAFCGSDGQSNRIANLIALLIEGNGAIGQISNIHSHGILRIYRLTGLFGCILQLLDNSAKGLHLTINLYGRADSDTVCKAGSADRQRNASQHDAAQEHGDNALAEFGILRAQVYQTDSRQGHCQSDCRDPMIAGLGNKIDQQFRRHSYALTCG